MYDDSIKYIKGNISIHFCLLEIEKNENCITAEYCDQLVTLRQSHLDSTHLIRTTMMIEGKTFCPQPTATDEDHVILSSDMIVSKN